MGRESGTEASQMLSNVTYLRCVSALGFPLPLDMLAVALLSAPVSEASHFRRFAFASCKTFLHYKLLAKHMRNIDPLCMCVLSPRKRGH